MSQKTVRARVREDVAGVSSRDQMDQRVVTSAEELFLRDGLESVKMVDIAREAGTGVATLYRHFKTKTHLAVLAATRLWERFNAQLTELVVSDAFMALNGLGRLQALLEGYCDAYCSNADFVTFVYAFDHMILAGQVDQDELAKYDAQLDSFYTIFEEAYMLGLDDGSIVRRIDFKRFYTALAHALMSVAQKMSTGEVIPSDDFSHGRDELQSIVDMALWSLASNVQMPPLPESVRLGC